MTSLQGTLHREADREVRVTQHHPEDKYPQVERQHHQTYSRKNQTCLNQ